MNTKIFTLLFLASSFFSFAQIDLCIEPNNNASNLQSGIYSGSIDPAVLASYEPVVFNVYFWWINDSNGDNERPVTETNILRRVAKLNLLYNKFNVFFKYRGYDDTSFNSTTYYTGSGIGAIRAYAEQEGFIEPNSFNIYVAYTFGAGAGQSDYNVTYCVTNSYHFLREDNGVMLHEVAHNFYIKHTRSYNEHTTRDEFLPNGDINPDFNAKDAGDEVVDTAANSGFYHSSCGCRLYIDTSDCTYFGEEEDNIGYSYVIEHEDVINLMSDSGTVCVDSYALTIGQGIRIRETIAADVNGVFADAETTVASLYEPYRGSYPEYYPHPEPWEYPLFQPGFEYRFVECECECPAPTDYDNISFTSDNNNVLLLINKDEADYNTITHPNHSAIAIKHEIGDVFWPQARKCYDNYNSPPVIGGSVITFNDGVLNTNVTVTSKDSTSINDTQLIDNLEPGLYNVIKNYQNGNTEETLILKGNN